MAEAECAACRDRIADLKELLTQRISAEQRVAGEHFVAIDKALVLRAKEIDAHLAALNGEAARLREMQTTYLPREVADERHAKMIEAMQLLREYRAGELARQALITMLMSAAISGLVGGIMAYLRAH